jgi:hypothetical protein
LIQCLGDRLVGVGLIPVDHMVVFTRDGVCCGDIHEFQENKIVAILAISDELNVSVDLLDRVLVVPGEVPCNADQSWSSPLDLLAVVLSEAVHDQ